MITIFQVTDFISSRPMREKYLGSFYSQASAEEKLGWYFIHQCCRVERF